MSTAREEIIARIRQALPDVSVPRAEDHAAIRRQYEQVGQLDAAQKLALFEERLRDYDATVYRCAKDRISEAVAQAMAARGKKSMVVPADVPRAWLPKGPDFKPGDRLSYKELDASEGVITGCAAAIAITGTIVLQHSPGQGRRAMTLIPDYHLCVVFANQIVETVAEALRELDTSSRFPMTTISGPSATADIEMTRVKGVHGPRHLDVIVVQE
jgi:L-lactate dehydrogenase complex protein LldG